MTAASAATGCNPTLTQGQQGACPKGTAQGYEYQNWSRQCWYYPKTGGSTLVDSSHCEFQGQPQSVSGLEAVPATLIFLADSDVDMGEMPDWISINGKEGNDVSIRIPDIKPQLPGTKFQGWERFAGEPLYQPGDYVHMSYGGNIELHASFSIANDTTPPSISGVTDRTINVGDVFDPLAGVTATDDVDGDLTSKIQVNGHVDNQTVGSYELIYMVSDVAGNKAEAKRTITVIDSGTTIACAPQTGDPAASVWQRATILLGLTAISLVGYMLLLQHRMRRRFQ